MSKMLNFNSTLISHFATLIQTGNFGIVEKIDQETSSHQKEQQQETHTLLICSKKRNDTKI